MGSRFHQHFLLGGLALFAPLCLFGQAPLKTTYYHVWDEPGGPRHFYNVPAVVTADRKDQARVDFEVAALDGAKQAMVQHVPAKDLQLAQSYLESDDLFLKMPNGGAVPARALRIVILNFNQTLQVAMEVEYEDPQPHTDIERLNVPLRSVQGLGALFRRKVPDPRSVGLAHQRFLVGAAPVAWDAKSNRNLPALPVVVLCARDLEDGTPVYLIVEKRDLLDPKTKYARLYWIPQHWLRIPTDSKDYENYLVALTNPELARKHGLVREQVLFPWTHEVVSLYGEEPPASVESDNHRLNRRARILLKWLGSQPDGDEERFALGKSRCSDFLYEQSQKPQETP